MTGFTNKGRTTEKMLLCTAWITFGEGSGGGELISGHRHTMKGKGEKRDRLFSATPNDRKWDNGHCGVSFLGNVPKETGHSSDHLGLGDPALSRRSDLMVFSGPF